jgi:16S rRNA (cytidine1402-2'-O)-methyltransferase
MTGSLVLLPTPIAAATALAVLPAEVLDVARRIEHFLAENAKSARAFLKSISYPRPLREVSIVEIGHDPDAASIERWFSPLRAGHDVALVSEAGCPAIADPGATLVAAAHAAGIVVRPLVGPSAPLLALMASGLNGQRFRFHGYLPIDAVARSARIRGLEHESRTRDETQIFIETPYRSAALFAALVSECRPSTRIAVSADLTGDGEFIRTLTAQAWREQGGEPPIARQPTVFCLLASHAAASSGGRA